MDRRLSVRRVGDDTAPRFFHRASRLADGRVMVTGGMGVQLLPLSLFSRGEISFFDPGAGRFVDVDEPTGSRPALILARSRHTQTTLSDGRVLITGGRVNAVQAYVGDRTPTVEMFDPATGTITAGPPMAVARAEHTATLLPDGRVVVAGSGSWQVFTPGPDTWSAGAPLQRTRSAHAAVLIADHGGVGGDHRVLLAGGIGSGWDTLELLDPASMTSLLLQSRLDAGLSDMAAARLPDGRVFITGGQVLPAGNTTDRTYLYDVAADRLSPGPPLPDLPGGLADHQLVILAGLAVVIGGEQQVNGRDAEQNYVAAFVPATDAWTVRGTMLFSHDDAAAVKLSEDSVLVIGGGVSVLGQEAPSKEAEILVVEDPGTAVPGLW